jgi:acetoin:2,6-dichlorophenolindophenol oxidoreductase subunit alpha
VAFDSIEEAIRTQIIAGVRFALEAPYPDADEVSMHVYA